jgi:uncharacterized protein YndB with AHSA1/START domain
MYQLEINRQFNVPVSRLYSAWCDPQVIRGWFAPGEMHVAEADADVREGGRYRIVMQEPQGEQHIVGGEYREVDENRRLVFTWQWQNSPTATLVALDFSEPVPGQSALRLVHSEFIDQESCDHHQKGWIGCLAKLFPEYTIE